MVATINVAMPKKSMRLTRAMNRSCICLSVLGKFRSQRINTVEIRLQEWSVSRARKD